MGHTGFFAIWHHLCSLVMTFHAGTHQLRRHGVSTAAFAGRGAVIAGVYQAPKGYWKCSSLLQRVTA